jgi:hypothetical protein
LKETAKKFGGFIFYSYLCIVNKNNKVMREFLNIMRTIILIECIISAIVAHGCDNDLAFTGWVVAALMTINSFNNE